MFPTHLLLESRSSQPILSRSLGARFPHAPVVMTFPSAPVLETASYRTSTATLTDAALWEDIVKSQVMKAGIVSIPKVCCFLLRYP